MAEKFVTTAGKYTHLLSLAHQAKENPYSPYSGYRVGAALLTKTGDTINCLYFHGYQNNYPTFLETGLFRHEQKGQFSSSDEVALSLCTEVKKIYRIT